MLPTTWYAIPGVAGPKKKNFAVWKKLETHPDSKRNGTESLSWDLILAYFVIFSRVSKILILFLLQAVLGDNLTLSSLNLQRFIFWFSSSLSFFGQRPRRTVSDKRQWILFFSCEKQLYKRLCWSVGWSVGPSVGPSVTRFSKIANSSKFK